MLQGNLIPGKLECGIDEAGRGCLAGPVFAAAVILPPGFYLEALNDSKQLSSKQRMALRTIIRKQALAYAVASVSNREIDEINILNATFKAMHAAMDKLKKVQADYILIDGNRFKLYGTTPFYCIIKGDATFQSIAAASILAKTYRDEYMTRLHKTFRHYQWSTNFGYATEQHREAIVKHGLTKYHRRTFQNYPQPEQGELFAAAKPDELAQT